MRHRKLDAPYRLTPLPCGGPARLDPSLELNQGDPPCSSPPWPPGPRQGWAACSDRFWLLELRVSQHFSTFYGSSVQAMDTQLNAQPTLPVLVSSVRTPEDRFAFDSNRFSVGGGVPDSLKPGRAGPSQKSPDAAGSYKFPLQGCSATRCPFLTGVNERFIER